MKIAIVGCPGSGKSTLALKLHKILDVPVYHLDQYFWKPGWQRPDRDEFEKIHKELCDKNTWVIDGMATRLFDYRAQKADIIIFLDIPLYKCLYRIFKRALTCFGQVRDTSASGCPERLPDREFLKYVFNFNKKYKPEILIALEKYKHEKKIFVARNNKEIDQLIKKLNKNI